MARRPSVNVHSLHFHLSSTKNFWVFCPILCPHPWDLGELAAGFLNRNLLRWDICIRLQKSRFHMWPVDQKLVSQWNKNIKIFKRTHINAYFFTIFTFLSVHNTLWSNCYYSRPFFRWEKWGQNLGVTQPRLILLDLTEQSQDLNPGCPWYQARSFRLCQGGGHSTKGHQPLSSNIPADTPPPCSPQSYPPPWFSEVELFSRQEHYSPRKSRFWCWEGLGEVAGKKSAHKQLKQIRFLKIYIAASARARAADGGGGLRRCWVLFCHRDAGTNSANWTPM